jgi:uncharacterized protein (DUF3820 family)
MNKMLGENYKLKTGKHAGKTLKEVPPSYLLYCYDNNFVMEQVARRFVVANEMELRELTKTN